ncbi:MAG TPA: DUF3459 domain-containing protein [Chloroflexi bacterium]|nr:DUF3459 domain-containing protein [Chloroflexota bacterium]
MEEFVFGTLSTTEKRVAYLKERRRGVRHLHRLQPRAPRAGESPVITVTVETARVIERVECVLSEPDTAVIPLILYHNKWDVLNWAYMETWQAALPSQPDGALVRYRIRAIPADGSEPVWADDGAVFSYLVGDPAQPEWARSAIVYQIFPDRFYPGDGRDWNEVTNLNDIYGGTLRGVIQKLDYVADMGFNAIWLNPFFPDDNTHHGYHAIDYFSVNPRLGSLDDIRELALAAHDRGIRLILDFVANHWSSQHETFQEAARNPDSEFVEWYHWIDYPDDYETFFGVMTLPRVNVDHPQVRDYLLRSAQFWLGEMGFDGLRLDYALGPSHDFWTDLRRAAKNVNPDAWLFGEVVETPETILSYEGRMDGCLDFPLAQAFRDLFALGRMDLAAFDHFLAQQDAFYPATFSRPTFLDNHDMNRFYWLTGEDKRKLKLAALCQFTLTGQPIVYNGTEVGVHQEKGMNEPGSQGMVEGRQPMLWGEAQDGEIREHFRRLIQLRRAHPVFWRGERQTVHLDAAAGTYVYARYDDAEVALVGLNLSEERRVVTAVFSHNGRTLEHTLTLDAWSGDIVVIG